MKKIKRVSDLRVGDDITQLTKKYSIQMDVYYKYPVTVAKITDDCIWIRYYRLGYGEFVEKPKFKRYFETFLNNRLPKIVGIY